MTYEKCFVCRCPITEPEFVSVVEGWIHWNQYRCLEARKREVLEVRTGAVAELAVPFAASQPDAAGVLLPSVSA